MFTDGSSVDLGQQFLVLNWGNTYPVNRVLGSNRVSTNITYPSPFPASIRAGYGDGVAGGGDFGIYHQEFDLAAVGLNVKALYSITFTIYSTNNYSVFAVSGDALGSPAPPPVLSIHRTGDMAELTWNRGFLQSKTELDAPWIDMPDAASPHAMSLSEPRGFFRVRE